VETVEPRNKEKEIRKQFTSVFISYQVRTFYNLERMWAFGDQGAA
jgi:ribosomal silencing factor RsfS